jgi:hypothetical protein
MKQPKGIDWKHVTFVMGTRVDLAPNPLPQPVFVRTCENCGAETLTATEYPLDVPMVCNVCASKKTVPVEHDETAQLLYDMPNEVKARLIDMAHQQRLPVEEIFKDFLEWKLGRRTKASLYNKSKKNAKE